MDSGNLAACLWTLKQSCLGLADEPLLSNRLWQGIRDHIQLLLDASQEPSVSDHARIAIRDLAAFAEPLEDDAASWIGALPWLEQQMRHIEGTLDEDARNSTPADPYRAAGLVWWAGETAARLRGVRNQVESLMPWALPEYLPLFHLDPIERITLASLPSAHRDVERQVAEWLNNPRAGETERGSARLMQRRLPSALDNTARLSQTLQRAR